MCEAKWPSVVAYVSMDHIFVQTVYRTGTDEIGALEKKMYLRSSMLSGRFKHITTKEVEPRLQQSIYMFEKTSIWWVCGNLHPTTQEWNYIPDFVIHFYRIYVSNTLSQTNSTSVKSDYKIMIFCMQTSRVGSYIEIFSASTSLKRVVFQSKILFHQPDTRFFITVTKQLT